jgi:hypothetical protein
LYASILIRSGADIGVSLLTTEIVKQKLERKNLFSSYPH